MLLKTIGYIGFYITCKQLTAFFNYNILIREENTMGGKSNTKQDINSTALHLEESVKRTLAHCFNLIKTLKTQCRNSNGELDIHIMAIFNSLSKLEPDLETFLHLHDQMELNEQYTRANEHFVEFIKSKQVFLNMLKTRDMKGKDSFVENIQQLEKYAREVLDKINPNILKFKFK